MFHFFFSSFDYSVFTISTNFNRKNGVNTPESNRFSALIAADRCRRTEIIGRKRLRVGLIMTRRSPPPPPRIRFESSSIRNPSWNSVIYSRKLMREEHRLANIRVRTARQKSWATIARGRRKKHRRSKPEAPPRVRFVLFRRGFFRRLAWNVVGFGPTGTSSFPVLPARYLSAVRGFPATWPYARPGRRLNSFSETGGVFSVTYMWKCGYRRTEKNCRQSRVRRAGKRAEVKGGEKARRGSARRRKPRPRSAVVVVAFGRKQNKSANDQPTDTIRRLYVNL